MSELGPKMRLLNERQRAMVIAYVEGGHQNYSRAYKAAGYAAPNKKTVDAGSSRAFSNPKIKAAILEETSNRLYGFAPVALKRVMEIALDKKHKDSFAAAKHILAATGFHSTQQIDVNHGGQVEMGFSEVRAMIENLKRAGLQQLPSPVTIDVEAEEIK